MIELICGEGRRPDGRSTLGGAACRSCLDDGGVHNQINLHFTEIYPARSTTPPVAVASTTGGVHNGSNLHFSVIYPARSTTPPVAKQHRRCFPRRNSLEAGALGCLLDAWGDGSDEQDVLPLVAKSLTFYFWQVPAGLPLSSGWSDTSGLATMRAATGLPQVRQNRRHTALPALLRRARVVLTRPSQQVEWAQNGCTKV